MRRYPTTMDYIKDFVKGGLFLCAWAFGILVGGLLIVHTLVSVFESEHGGFVLTVTAIFIIGGLIRISSKYGDP